MIMARGVFRFEPKEPLTVEKVKQRQKALARVFHPDVAGGSAEEMKRINAAADVLLAALARPA
jgi:DnaJ-class molecular chaperone